MDHQQAVTGASVEKNSPSWTGTVGFGGESLVPIGPALNGFCPKSKKASSRRRFGSGRMSAVLATQNKRLAKSWLQVLRKICLSRQSRRSSSPESWKSAQAPATSSSIHLQDRGQQAMQC